VSGFVYLIIASAALAKPGAEPLHLHLPAAVQSRARSCGIDFKLPVRMNEAKGRTSRPKSLTLAFPWVDAMTTAFLFSQ
jgi:hypothetical protein